LRAGEKQVAVDPHRVPANAGINTAITVRVRAGEFHALEKAREVGSQQESPERLYQSTVFTLRQEWHR
jgi:hypothetical protein